MNTFKVGFFALLVFALSHSDRAWSFGSHASPPLTDSGKIWVVRADGAQSCGIKQGQSIESVAGDLKNAGITVFEARKGSDGKKHTMVCGAPVGSVNAFLIGQADLPKALALGFVTAPTGFPGK